MINGRVVVAAKDTLATVVRIPIKGQTITQNAVGTQFLHGIVFEVTCPVW